MNEGYRLFWGDTHHNTYMHSVQDPPLAEVVAFASIHLDFYTGAYYTPVFTNIPVKRELGPAPRAPAAGHLWEGQAPASGSWSGVNLEDFKNPETLKREWSEVQEVTAAWNRPGRFVAFPGFEWQGNGEWGDHNVVYRSEGHPVQTVRTLSELYAALRGREAIAIPHHTGYLPGQRAPLWTACDDTLSPFSEIYSVHGGSETDEEWIGLRRNSNMGPGVGGGTYQDALDAGLHLGAICSTDNWDNMPGHWNQGLMACLAGELTRDGLWEAFLARRVYGVTGDRIQLEFTCNGQCMGSIMPFTPRRELRVSVRGSEAIDRIELLRNGRVIATHCHQGTWHMPPRGRKTLFKFRVEPGWGPRPGQLPPTDRRWEGELHIAGGRLHAWEPCWVTLGQQVPELAGDTARFRMISRTAKVPGSMQGATVFEFEADPDAEMIVRLNGMEDRDRVRAFACRSRLLWYREETVERLRKTVGLEPEGAQREDVYYHNAPKAKLHRVIPEAGYATSLELTDEEPLEGETHYRARVEQRNGQRAWSSPVWVKPDRSGA